MEKVAREVTAAVAAAQVGTLQEAAAVSTATVQMAMAGAVEVTLAEEETAQAAREVVAKGVEAQVVGEMEVEALAVGLRGGRPVGTEGWRGILLVLKVVSLAVGDPEVVFGVKGASWVGTKDMAQAQPAAEVLERGGRVVEMEAGVEPAGVQRVGWEAP